MTLIIKNNNIYYHNFKILNYELSLLLVPLFILITFYFKNLIVYFSNIYLLVFICGSIDSYVKSKIYNLPLIFYANLIFHIIGLYPLINFKKYFKPNLINYGIGLIALILILLLPYWPYDVDRKIFIIILIIIYFLTTSLYYILYKK